MREHLIETIGRALADADQEDYMEDCIQYDQRARAALASLPTLGLALVPVVATEGMLNGARDWSIKKNGMGVGNDQASGCYAAMLAAAPDLLREGG